MIMFLTLAGAIVGTVGTRTISSFCRGSRVAPLWHEWQCHQHLLLAQCPWQVDGLYPP